MKVIDRYIAGIVLKHSLMVLIAIVLLVSLFSLIDEVSDVGKGDYRLLDSVFFIFLQMPARIYEFFPVAALIGGLIGMGRLASQSELTVMRSAGMSLAQISRSVLIGTLALMVIVIFVGEAISPKSSQLGRQMKTLAISGGDLVKSERGVWVRDGQNYVHIRVILPDGQLEGVTRFQFENQQLVAMIYAQSAEFDSNNVWVLSNIQQTFITDEQINTTAADVMNWKTELTPETLGIVSLKPEDLNLVGLAEYSRYLKENGLNATRYDLAYWKKVMQPMAVAVMMFLALSFISGPLRSTPIGARIVLGMIVGFTFNMLSNIFGPVSLVYQMPAFLAAALPIVVFAIITVLLMRRAR
jgi:lipopolysaccharide export system permease protein